MVYLDNNATTALHPDVYAVMEPWLTVQRGNPSSRHRAGQEARSAIEQAREQVAALVNAHPREVIFTSGGTEANNMALKGVCDPGKSGQGLAVSSIEHAAILGPARSLARRGCELTLLPVDAAGVVNPASVGELCGMACRMLSVMWANNETGAVQPLAELASWSEQRGVILHTDAVQAAGKIPVDFRLPGLQLMSISGHKMYGPQGVGALLVKKGLELNPLLEGGGQEYGLRAGSENVAAIVGFGKAADLARVELHDRSLQLEQQRRWLEQAIQQQLPDAVIFSAGAERLPNTVFFAVPGLDGETLIMALDRDGYAVSSGSACGSSHDEPSPVLKAMGVNRDLAQGAIRVSLGRTTSRAELEGFMHALCSQVQALRGLAAATAW